MLDIICSMEKLYFTNAGQDHPRHLAGNFLVHSTVSILEVSDLFKIVSSKLSIEAKFGFCRRQGN